MMCDLRDAVENTAENYNNPSARYSELRAAGIRWAEVALRTFDGELLRKALFISAAITDFSNELEKKGS